MSFMQTTLSTIATVYQLNENSTIYESFQQKMRFAMSGILFYNLLDRGIANTLGLETLRHGTNPLNNLKIRFLGGDPQRGGNIGGSSRGIGMDPMDKYFYLIKDSGFCYQRPPTEPETNFTKSVEALPIFMQKLGLAGQHAQLSTWNAFPMTSENDVGNGRKVMTAVKSIFMNILLQFTPTLRFRFASIDTQIFNDDPQYFGGNAAFKTAHKVEFWRIGILGSLCVGLNRDLFKRIKANPHRFITGVAQLVGAVAMFTFAMQNLTFTPATITALALGIIVA